MPEPKPAPPNAEPPAKQSAASAFLLVYNFLSAVWWFALLGQVAAVTPQFGVAGLYRSSESFARWTQTLAIVEVLTSLLGIVRTPLLTTVMQVGSRFLLVWVIAFFFPETTSKSQAYPTMLVAWSVTELIRYSYFATMLGAGPSAVPGFLKWLRYNTFFVLYPMGIISECWLISLAIKPAEQRFGPPAAWALYAVLAIYVPGSYVLYTHMMKQRRRIMRGKQPVRQ